MFKLQRNQQIAILVVSAIFLFGAGFQYARWTSEANDVNVVSEANASSVENESQKSENMIFVDISGAVENPGLYQFPEGSRVDDALEKAVPLENADLRQLNLAQVLTDEQKILVYTTDGQDPNCAGFVASGQNSSQLVNINTATVAELETLPGIGASLATRIISYRENNGSFAVLEDLKNVSGIGDKRYEELADKITL